jgi:hypothetical protein
VSNDEALILDILQDDVQSFSLLLNVLNDDSLPYRRRRFGREISQQELTAILARLFEAGYVTVYRELTADGHFELIALPPNASLSKARDWFGLTSIGTTVA